MKDLTIYIFEIFCKPFKSRLFVIFFFLFFIPMGPFSIYYKWFASGNTLAFYEYFTPESIFTFTAPLMAAIIIDGLILAINHQSELTRESAEFELFRDSMVLAAIIMLIQGLIIYNSISKDSILLSLLSVFILWFFWIVLSSSKNEFTPHKQWRSTGSADDTTSEAITNG